MMFHGEKTINLTIKSTRLLCGFLFAAIVASMPISTSAQCSTGWNARGAWDFRQVGQRKPIKLRLDQKGQALTGTAVLPDGKETRGSGMAFDGIEDLSGTADGYISGDSFSLHIFWENGSTGVYSARILPSGKVEGKAHEKGSPHILVSWDSVGRLSCPPPPPPPIVQKVIKGTGRKPAPKPEAPVKTFETAASEIKAPGMIVSQVVYEFPGAPAGYVILAWDGGPDHQYAEIWVKVNGGEPEFVVEQGKGQRRVTVERGKTYEYLLMDAGEKLSSVGFKTPRY